MKICKNDEEIHGMLV